MAISTGTFYKGTNIYVPILLFCSVFEINYGYVKQTIWSYAGTSEGCFLIDMTTRWSEFMGHFLQGVGKIGVINNFL
jgi:hypothetical protein